MYTSRKLAQSMTTNMVAMTTAIETLNRVLRMEAPLAAGECPPHPEVCPTMVNIFCNGNREARLFCGDGDRAVIGRASTYD
jgi:hypothetical protein